MIKHDVNQIAQIFANNIKRARNDAGKTQREIAIALDVDKLAVYRWEKATARPSIEHLVALADHLDKSVAWFYTPHHDDEVVAA